MLINISSASSLEYRGLKTKIIQLGYPALLLDESTKILFRNREAERKYPKFRVGSLLANRISGECAAYISEMPVGESLSATLLPYGNGSVTLIRCEDCFLAVFLPMLDEIQKSISEKYGLLSGYDIPAVPLALNSDRNRFDKFARVALDLLDIKGRRQQTCFNAATTLESLGNELDTAGYGKVDLKIISDDLLVRGSECDFIMIAAFAVSVCFGLSGSDIGITLDNRGLETALTVSARNSGGESDCFGGFADIKNSRVHENEASFWLYMLKLLADANLWELRCESRSDGATVFELSMPCVRSGEEMLVFEPRRDIVSAVVSALLCK